MTNTDPAPIATAPRAASVDRAPTVVTVTMALAQFGLFVGLLAPVTVSLAIKTQTLVPADQAAAVNGNVLAVAALFALIGNPVFGRLSDLTMSRYGRRRPWMVGGAVVFVGAMLVVALATSVSVLLVGWCVAQLAGNAMLAALLATIADQVPPAQRASVAANVGVMQSLGILAAAYIAALFVDSIVALFVVPGVIALVLVVVFCAVLPDRQLTHRPEIGGWLALLRTFWVNPVRHPDFGWAWLSRFLVFLAYFLFISFRMFYLQQHVGLPAADAAGTLALGALVFTIALVITAKIGGWLSDRTGLRKIFVVVSILILAIAFALLGVTTTVPGFLLVEAVMGLGYGVYYAVDTALVVDVLPDRENAAKDLGVMNIANALPQSLAAALGGVLLAIGTDGASTNYVALFIGAGTIGMLGALAILPIRSVR